MQARIPEHWKEKEADEFSDIRTSDKGRSIWIETEDHRMVHVHFLGTTIVTVWDGADKKKEINFSCKKLHKVKTSRF